MIRTKPVLVLACMMACALFAHAAAAQRAAAASADPGKIIKVEILPLDFGERVLLGNSGARHLPKFVRARASDGQPVLVTWRAPRGGLPNGATVFLEYRLMGDDAARRASVRLDCPVAGEQATRILVPPTGVGSPRIEAWRVVVMAGNAVIAERLSPGWSGRS